MSNFSIDLLQSKKAVESEEALVKQLASIEMAVTSVRGSLNLGAATARIKSRLSELASDVNEESRSMKEMKKGLDDINQKYTKTEKDLLGISTSEGLPSIAGWAVQGLGLNDNDKGRLPTFSIPDIDLPFIELSGFHIEEGFIGAKDDMTLASVGTSVTGVLWEAGGEGSYGIASGSYNVAAGQAEASASAYAGLLGVGAQVGVGVTAFTASAQGSLGNEYFNLHGSTEVNVGHVGAEAAVNVGLVDENGNFNPQLGGSLSAEALLAEASATVGGTIAGTEINATGSVNIGVGAHADVGLNDGVLSLDIGASVGIGVSVSLEIDFSGTVNAVADFASNAWSGITGLFG